MALSADQLAVLRSHVGADDPPSDDDLDTLYDRLGSVGAVALEVLRGRLTEMLLAPGKMSLEGDYSREYTAAQIKALQTTIAELEVSLVPAVEGSTEVLGTVQLVRLDPTR